ncbi:MAG: hypothetical protein ACREBJ_12030, partial [Nitrosotalea sp.]
MDASSDNQDSTNPILQKIKDYSGVASGAAASVVGISTYDPILAISGVVTFFSSFIAPFERKNGSKFLDDLKRDFEELEKQRNIKFSEMLNSDKVLSAILEAYPIAVRTYQEEKREILRNTILNISLPSNIDDDLQFSFINYVGRLTPSHIVALQKYSDYWNLSLGERHDWNKHFDITEIELKYQSYLDELISFGLLIRPDMTSDSAGAHMGSRTCILHGKG